MSFVHREIGRDRRVVWTLSLALALAMLGAVVLLGMVVGAPLLVLYMAVLTVALLTLSVAVL